MSRGSIIAMGSPRSEGVTGSGGMSLSGRRPVGARRPRSVDELLRQQLDRGPRHSPGRHRASIPERLQQGTAEKGIYSSKQRLTSSSSGMD